MRLDSAYLCLLLAAFLPGTGLPQTPRSEQILTRDIDKRPLPQVSVKALSPAMQKAVKEIVEQDPRPESYSIYQIPVAPKAHRMYLVEQEGKSVCAINGPNCAFTVLDESANQVTTVVDTSGVGIAVVRRPNLQMPDIAAYEQLGHFATYTTVFRFDGRTWKPFRCKETPIADAADPHPSLVADKPCTP